MKDWERELEAEAREAHEEWLEIEQHIFRDDEPRQGLHRWGHDRRERALTKSEESRTVRA